MKLRSIASVGCAAALALTLCVGCTADNEEEATQSEPSTAAQEAVDVAEDADTNDVAANVDEEQAQLEQDAVDQAEGVNEAAANQGVVEGEPEGAAERAEGGN